ncbi:hypothetical protein C8Q76DRAFT_67412 [Earliella scabrosa]|nr:hypothetical protein C8Q76DRAFT_67412 [Earliella scabrosa]
MACYDRGPGEFSLLFFSGHVAQPIFPVQLARLCGPDGGGRQPPRILLHHVEDRLDGGSSMSPSTYRTPRSAERTHSRRREPCVTPQCAIIPYLSERSSFEFTAASRLALPHEVNMRIRSEPHSSAVLTSALPTCRACAHMPPSHAPKRPCTTCVAHPSAPTHIEGASGRSVFIRPRCARVSRACSSGNGPSRMRTFDPLRSWTMMVEADGPRMHFNSSSSSGDMPQTGESSTKRLDTRIARFQRRYALLVAAPATVAHLHRGRTIEVLTSNSDMTSIVRVRARAAGARASVATAVHRAFAVMVGLGRCLCSMGELIVRDEIGWVGVGSRMTGNRQ